MSRWFRHYAGMMRDEKLVRAAVISGQPVERVVWIWGAILESAAEINDGGRYDFDSGECAYFLRCDYAGVDGALVALEKLGRIRGGVVLKWSERQFDSDSSRERQKRYRDRHKSKDDVSGDVTPPSRDGAVTLQDTDTDTDTELEDVGANAPTSPEPAKAAPVAIGLPTVSDGDFPIFEADIAEWASAFPAVDVRQQLAAMRSWLNANPTRRKTKRGMRKFVVTWLDRRQNAGAAPSPPARAGPANGRMNVVEANLARRTKRDEPGSGRRDYGDAELLPPDKPELRGLIGHVGQAMRWDDGSGHH